MKKQKSKIQNRKTSFTVSEKIIIGLAAIVFFVAAGFLVYYLGMYRKANQEYGDLQTIAFAEETDEGTETEERTESGDNPGIDSSSINFDALKAINPDCVAWIRFDDGKINYPVMKGTDNEYYLTHTFNGKELTAASIFMDYQNSEDFSDQNTFVYGHNMKDGSMFGELNKYEDQDYYENHPFFTIDTPEQEYRYQIFSVYLADVNTEADLFQTSFSDMSEYQDYLDQITRNSICDTGVDVSPEDQIVTLQTCNKSGHEYRFLVHGVLIKE